MTLVYQVSALSLVLLAIVLFLNRIFAPLRKTVAEARVPSAGACAIRC